MLKLIKTAAKLTAAALVGIVAYHALVSALVCCPLLTAGSLVAGGVVAVKVLRSV